MSRNTVFGAALIAAALAAVGVALFSGGDAPALDPRFALAPDDPAIVALGERVYAENCAACHGADLEGEPNWRDRGPDGLLPAPPHDETGHTWHHPDAVLVLLTALGPGGAIGDPTYRSAMPAFQDVLTLEEIVASLSYIKSRWPADIRARHDRLNAAADAAAQERGTGG